MSKEKKARVIHVDELIIHAKEVKVIGPVKEEEVYKRRDPWGFFGGGPTRDLEERRDLDDKESDAILYTEELSDEQEEKQDVLEEAQGRKERRWI
ncbi:hypothetical protein ACOI1C_20095 [Bacillus sp. DJP31]|uniref:hypothetical protein n=1 Tax=Bacillus sp. DJP31 TaxID=3409789 RepID=UPI003BB59E35